MANPIETAKKHLGSVAERTWGRGAYRKGMSRFTNPDNSGVISKSFRRANKTQSVTLGFFEALAPISSRLVMPYLENDENNTGRWDYILIPARIVGPAIADAVICTYSLSLLLHNPVEGVLFKAGANAAIQAGLDFAETAVNRIRNFRPPTTSTFAV